MIQVVTVVVANGVDELLEDAIVRFGSVVQKIN